MNVPVTEYLVRHANEYEATLRAAVERPGPALVDLPTRPLPDVENIPIDWLESEE